ncbi:hypothetical protein [Arthrobacter antioxidans]|uniref:CIS tube protein n=1 Tax=Arthrobacter antioxidans TaxID=2895818 RepID=UPI001FFFCE46|nr:hypothetical protein [Arthrobacter antioxidans]
MSTFPGSPRLVRGYLRIHPDDAPGTPAQTIAFQYNPGEIRRSLAHRRPQKPEQGAAPQDARLVAGPPTETLTLGIELDATDALGETRPDRTVVESGLHMPLAALEMLMYPASAEYERTKDQAEQGQITVEAGNLPLVLLNWGDSRVVPVMLTSFSITEQEFDARLNPIRAKVDLGLQVLTYLDLGPGSTGIDAFLSYQKEKERLARGYFSAGAPTRTQHLNAETG